jgi:hypothetical protein
MATLVQESADQKAHSLNYDIADLDQQASSHYRLGEYDECVDVLRRAYHLREKLLGAKHVDTLMNLNNLGAALGRLGLLEEAEQAFRDVLVGRMEVSGKKHNDTFTTMNHLGVLLKQLGQFEESDALLYTALEGFYNLHGMTHICTAEVAFSYGVLAVQQGKRNKAAYMFSVAVVGLVQSLGSGHQHTKDAIAWEEKCRATYANDGISTGKKGSITVVDASRAGVIPSIHAPLPSLFDVDEMDYAEGIFQSKKDWKKKVKFCVNCGIKYTLTRREHHCRICSSSVCGDCSKAKAYVMESSITSSIPGAANVPTLERCCAICEAQGFV